MHIHTKARVAVTALVDIAIHEAEGPVPLHAVSARTDISLSYLEQVFGVLRKGGLVKSTRGPGGGYRIARPLAAISIADIIQVVEGIPDGGPVDPGAANSRFGADAWGVAAEHAMKHLAKVTLADLVAAGEAQPA